MPENPYQDDKQRTGVAWSDVLKYYSNSISSRQVNLKQKIHHVNPYITPLRAAIVVLNPIYLTL